MLHFKIAARRNFPSVAFRAAHGTRALCVTWVDVVLGALPSCSQCVSYAAGARQVRDRICVRSTFGSVMVSATRVPTHSTEYSLVLPDLRTANGFFRVDCVGS